MKAAMFGALSLVLAGAGGLGSTAAAADIPSATANFSGTSLAIGIGYGWGKGALRFKGRIHPFRAKGLSVIGIGAAKSRGVAEIYHLQSLSDFPGLYVAAGAGGSAAEFGGGTAVLRNSKGVVIRLHTVDRGLQLNVAASGVLVELPED
ncbi:hypothetical protein [Phenylobacterium immobile]|uniref:hypothetical protein n=1 Tax=Phenylobacterium immobile TaxID=21 RepID=UPI000B85889F|nr:hypothetical protein [Phenylobacterium immobile]